jgi:hypothetical protein
MVKKIALVCGVALVLSVLAVVVVPARSSAKADSPNSAVVIKNGGCELFDGNGNVVNASGDQAVITHSGNSKITCRAKVPPSSTAQGAVHWNFANTGEECFTEPPVLTQHWEEVVTPSGQATLSCQFNGSSS